MLTSEVVLTKIVVSICLWRHLLLFTHCRYSYHVFFGSQGNEQGRGTLIPIEMNRSIFTIRVISSDAVYSQEDSMALAEAMAAPPKYEAINMRMIAK